jgi:hypothetical protein
MKKCKGCNNPFTPRFKTTEKYCWEVDCKTKEAMELLEKKRQSDLKARNKEKVEKKKELMTLSDWLKIAQTTFNAYIRKRDEKVPCISCQRHHQGQYHAGHYRTTAAAPQLRFNEFNVWKQCSACNNYKSGNITEYRINLVKMIGVDEVEKLENNSETRKFTIDEVKEINQIYKLKIKE